MRPADRIRAAVTRGPAISAPGVFDALSATLAAQAGFEVLFASGYGIAAARFGLPDFGLVTASEMRDSARLVCAAAGSVPVIVDADTGYGNALNVQRTVRELRDAGAARVLLEDQVWPKRCGHMSGKQVIATSEHVAKLRAARDAVGDELYLIARTDARAPLGLDAAIERALAYLEAGADATFVEAPRSVEELGEIARRVPGAKLANMLERGLTPILGVDELGALGYALVAHPLTALYAAAQVMREVFANLRAEGSSRRDLERILPWDEWNRVIGLESYYAAEKRYRGEEG
ncbi:MAG: isocitrate lyase/phosphoenolpyruvate mutase family protein [Deltaproteobacteria bacterium]|nr:isocitrate lyase/phosphoenolpyruvate mutase family protein [Deltaproteobacteria bacterium]